MKSTPFGIYLRDKLIASGFGEAKYFYGCSEAEIKQLEEAQKVDFLPETYRQFLWVMGHSCGSFWQGSDLLYRHAIDLKDAANADFKWLESTVRIPDDAFVFISHQGYVFYYFHTNNRDDDPPVYAIYEGEAPEKINGHLSEFYEQSILDFRSIPGNLDSRNRFETQVTSETAVQPTKNSNTSPFGETEQTYDTLGNTMQPNWNAYFRKEARRNSSLYSQLSANLRKIMFRLGFRHEKR